MAGNAQKTHLALTLNRFAEKKVYEAIQITGRALPCSVVSRSGSIVTVKFELTNVPFTLPNVTIPTAFPEYMRVPLQPGDGGMVVPADAYLGGVSGLGGGTADLSLRANLSALAFLPLANKNWGAPDRADAFVLYGPDGVVLRDKNSHCVLNLTPTGIVITVPTGQEVRINGRLVVTGNLNIGGSIVAEDGSTYGGDLRTTGNIFAGVGTGDAVDLQLHTHKYNRPTGASTTSETQSPTAGT